MLKKVEARLRRKERIRKSVLGTSERPRLVVFRSLNHLYAQVIDDHQGKTLLGLSTQSKDFSSKDKANVKGAKAFGLLMAKRAKEQKILRVVFDRGGFLYHGRVKAFAEGAREGGLEF